MVFPKVRLPFAVRMMSLPARAPVVVMLPPAITCIVFHTFIWLNVALPGMLKYAEPVPTAFMVGAVGDSGRRLVPIEPLPALKVRAPTDVMVPAVCVMSPVPPAVIVTVLDPFTLPPKVTLPPDEFTVNTPPDVMVPALVKSPGLLILVMPLAEAEPRAIDPPLDISVIVVPAVKVEVDAYSAPPLLMFRAPPADAPLSTVSAPLFDKYMLPVVLALARLLTPRFRAVVLEPMLPLPEESVRVAPVIAPPVCEMVPAPLAAISRVVTELMFAPAVMLPLFPMDCN